MKTPHTPGPWFIERRTNDGWTTHHSITASDGHGWSGDRYMSVAGCIDSNDAHLIAACREALAQKDEQEPVAIGTEWMPYIKLPIVVHVREQREGESHVSTREGITPVKHDDLIMRGVEGEEYPIGRALFDRTYTFPPTNTKSASR